MVDRTMTERLVHIANKKGLRISYSEDICTFALKMTFEKYGLATSLVIPFNSIKPDTIYDVLVAKVEEADAILDACKNKNPDDATQT